MFRVVRLNDGGSGVRLNGCVSVDVVSLIGLSGLISLFGSSRNEHVSGLIEVDGVSGRQTQ